MAFYSRSQALLCLSALSVLFLLESAVLGVSPQTKPSKKPVLKAAGRSAHGTGLTPVLSRAGSRWNLTFRTGDELRWLQKAVNPGREPVRIPVSLQPGRWLSGRLRPDGLVEVMLEEKDLLGLLPGWNAVTIQAPGWHLLTRRFDAAPLFRVDADLRAYAAARLRSVPLPDPASTAPAIPSRLEPIPEQTLPGVPGVRFDLPKGKPLTVSNDHRVLSIPISGKARKVYLLVSTRLPSPEMSRIGFLTGMLSEGALIIQELRAATDLQASGIVQASGEPLQVLELELGDLRDLEALRLEVTDPRATIQVESVSVLGGVRPGGFAGLPLRIQKQISGGATPLFAFDQPTLAGWEIQGSGWGTTDTVGEFFGRKGVSRYFADSKVVGGEPATGMILSPPFVLLTNRLTFLANGHGMKNYYALVDAADGRELLRSPVPEKTGPFEKITWDVTSFKGRRVRFKAVDADDRTAYAWLAFDDIELAP